MEKTTESELLKELKDLSRHVASIDEALKKLVSKDGSGGLKLELPIYDKLTNLERALTSRR